MPWYGVLFIIGIVIYGLYEIISSIAKWYSELPRNRKCYSCEKLISEVDNFYFEGPYNRFMCALHPSKNYKKVFFDNDIHFIKMYKNLYTEDKRILKKYGTIDIITYEDSVIKTLIRMSWKERTVDRLIQFNNKEMNINTNISGIYKIIRKKDKKTYIGQSKWIEKRWENHKLSIDFENKFSDGSDFNHNDFNFEVIINCPIELLDFLEAYFISVTKSYEKGLNKTKGNLSHLTDEQLKIINRMNNVTQEFTKI